MIQNQTVLVAYDGSEEARHAIGVAARLLGPRRVDVVHVWEPVASAAARSAIYADAGNGVVDDLAREVRTAEDTADEGARIARDAGFDARPVAVEVRAGRRGAHQLRRQRGTGTRRRWHPRPLGRPLGGSRQRLAPRHSERHNPRADRPR